MKQLADVLYLLRGFPPNAIHVYLARDVLIDAATRQGERRIMRQIRGRRVAAHALTHAHPDHQGSSHAVAVALEIPVWCGADDADAVEDPRLIVERLPNHWLNRTFSGFWTGPPHPVARRL